jgi:hypothetical protein
MTEKERFLMKLLFEYDWKEAFPGVKIPEKARVYYSSRNWNKFAALIDDYIYSEKTIAQCAIENAEVGDKIPYKDSFATVTKITKKTLFLDYQGEVKKVGYDSKAYYDLICFLAPYVQRIYYGWSDTYDLQEMIERDECIEVDTENQVYVCERTIDFQLRTILTHFLGYEVKRNRHYNTPKEPMNVGTDFTAFAQRTLDKSWERPKELDVGFRVYKLEGDIGDKVATG